MYENYKRVMHHSKEVGLSPATILILSSLAETPNQRTTQLADEIHITQQAVGKLVQILATDGLVVSHEDDNDRRANSIYITKKGRNRVEKLVKKWDETE